MRVGIHTISWGQRPRSIQTMLQEARDAGYEGVELMQDPKVIGDPGKLLEALQLEPKLTLLGFSGGAPEERIQYVRRTLPLLPDPNSPRGFGIRMYKTEETTRPYIYVDDWEEDVHAPLLSQPDVLLALHPHMFKPVQTAKEASKLLQAHSALRFLPDTAHLMVAGENPVRVIEENFSRLAAVHLKDWTAEFGRAYQFYPRGFAHLGAGSVPLKQVLEMLVKNNYDGWIVVEQDWAANPSESAKRSREWLLHENGI